MRRLLLCALLGPAILMLSAAAEKSDRPPPGQLKTAALREFETLEAPRQKLITLALATSREFTLHQYHFGSADPSRGGFDCSGAMFYLLRKIGLRPTRSSAAQYEWLKREGTLHRVPPEATSFDDAAFDSLKPGDLIFWSGTYVPTDGRKNKVTHVQMYLGHEKSDGRRVMVGSTDGRSYRGTARCGYGVFDLKFPRPTSKARIVGYGTPPGLRPVTK